MHIKIVRLGIYGHHRLGIDGCDAAKPERTTTMPEAVGRTSRHAFAQRRGRMRRRCFAANSSPAKSDPPQ